MDEMNQIDCPHCGFNFDRKKHSTCSNCDFGNEKKNLLIVLSDKGLALPMGVKIAILLTSTYAMYTISEILINQFLINVLILAVYLGVLTLWSTLIDRIKRPMWFLSLILMLYLPILLLISVLLFL